MGGTLIERLGIGKWPILIDPECLFRFLAIERI